MFMLKWATGKGIESSLKASDFKCIFSFFLNYLDLDFKWKNYFGKSTTFLGLSETLPLAGPGWQIELLEHPSSLPRPPDSGDFHTESHWVQDAVFSGTLVPLNWPYRIIILLFEIKLCRVLNFITEFNINNYLQFNEFRYLLNCFWVVPLNLLKRRRTYSFNEQQKSLALTSAYILFSINQL